MTKTTTITVRLDTQVNKDAQALFKELGLTTTQAVKLFLEQVNLNKGLPFILETLNDETIQAIESSLNGQNLKTFEDVGATLDYLGL
jgi:DNA-damage-inducible protein J